MTILRIREKLCIGAVRITIKCCCIQYIDYSVNSDLIPVADEDRCPKNSHYKVINEESLGTCTCDSHCNWDVCRLVEPPDECILGSFSEWRWDTVKNGWVAQIVLGKPC